VIISCVFATLQYHCIIVICTNLLLSLGMSLKMYIVTLFLDFDILICSCMFSDGVCLLVNKGLLTS